MNFKYSQLFLDRRETLETKLYDSNNRNKVQPKIPKLDLLWIDCLMLSGVLGTTTVCQPDVHSRVCQYETEALVL